MLAGELASPAPHDRIIDVCAAPGGKSMNVALKLTDGSVEARDLTPLKTQLIRENIARLGLDNISVKSGMQEFPIRHQRKVPILCLRICRVRDLALSAESRISSIIRILKRLNSLHHYSVKS